MPSKRKWRRPKPRLMRRFSGAMLTALLVSISGCANCATKPSLAAPADKCYLGVLSNADQAALLASDPVRYAAAQAGDVLVAGWCARQQIEDLANQVRMLEAQ